MVDDEMLQIYHSVTTTTTTTTTTKSVDASMLKKHLYTSLYILPRPGPTNNENFIIYTQDVFIILISIRPV
jgi:hypothetical protein